MAWGVVALIVAALAVLAAIALTAISRRDRRRSKVALLLGVAFVAALWTTFTIARPVTAVPFDPNGMECLLDPFGETGSLTVRWHSDCGQAMARHLVLSVGPSLLVLVGVLVTFVLRLTRGRPRAVRWACAVAVPVLVSTSATVATVHQANDLQAECEEWSTTAAALLEGDTATGQLPVDLVARQRVWADQSDERRDQLARVWAASVVRDRAHELEDAMETVIDDPDYRAYSDNRMVVSECEYGHPTIDGAAVSFTGHTEYLTADEGEWAQSPLRRYQVDLVRDAGGDRWLLSSVVTDDLEGY